MAKFNTKGLVGIPVNSPQNALGTLVSETVLKIPLITGPSTQDRRIYWMSFVGFISIDNLTVGEGPVEVGVAHDDLTIGEIGEALDASDADQDDITARERRRRPVKSWGIFVGASGNEWLNNDQSKAKYRVKFSTGEDLEPTMWARNHHGTSLTTGATVNVFGKLWGRRY